MKRKRLIIGDCLKRNETALILYAVLEAGNYAVLRLYGLPMESFLYALVLGTAVLAVLLGMELVRAFRRGERRERMILSIGSQWESLPPPEDLTEADCREMIESLGRSMEALCREARREREDLLDYYTAWVHQIKTPIAVMKLNLAEDTEEGRALSAELFRIEQYVEMVLSYIRLGSETNDLVLRPVTVDEVIRETVRKYAGQFIRRRLRLEYEPTDRQIVTDKKWLGVILEQFVSNAVKYTPEGTVRITVLDSRLTVADTGIGVAPEDLPRIFEKGYTGLNGRTGRASSGLGLYLAKTAADRLGLRLTAESTPGEGSSFSVWFPEEN